MKKLNEQNETIIMEKIIPILLCKATSRSVCQHGLHTRLAAKCSVLHLRLFASRAIPPSVLREVWRQCFLFPSLAQHLIRISSKFDQQES